MATPNGASSPQLVKDILTEDERNASGSEGDVETEGSDDDSGSGRQLRYKKTSSVRDDDGSSSEEDDQSESSDQSNNSENWRLLATEQQALSNSYDSIEHSLTLSEALDISSASDMRSRFFDDEAEESSLNSEVEESELEASGESDHSEGGESDHCEGGGACIFDEKQVECARKKRLRAIIERDSEAEVEVGRVTKRRAYIADSSSNDEDEMEDNVSKETKKEPPSNSEDGENESLSELESKSEVKINKRVKAEYEKQLKNHEMRRAALQHSLSGDITDQGQRQLQRELKKVEGKIKKCVSLIQGCEKRIRDAENSIAEIQGEAEEKQRKKESKRLFDEAMQHGHILINIVNMLLFGPAGTGKTNLKHLLTENPPPLQRDSTPCIEKPVRIRPVSNTKFKSTGRGWVEMSEPKLLNLLAQIITKLPQESTGQSTASRVAESLKKMTKTEPISDSDEIMSGSNSSQSSNNFDTPPRLLDKAIDKVIASVVSGVAEELKLATQGTDDLLTSRDHQEEELLDSNWVYIIDSGGQPQFHDISPLFIKHISVALVVLRLIDELTSFPSDEYYKDGRLVGSPRASHMTLGETLQSLVQSIQSHTSLDKKPSMIFVGTFLDQLKSSDTLIKRNKEILDMLPPDIKKLLVYDDPGLNNLIFSLNTISREDDSLATANRIKIAVEYSIPLQVKVPVWWSFLDSLLQSLSVTLKRGVLSIEECLRLAARFGYVLKDLEAALVFFDEVCIVHYYPSILPNTVFVDSQIPLDKITELSQHAISLRTAEVHSRSTLSTGVTEAKWKRFRDEGIITVEFLRLFKKQYVEGIFSPEDMLLIMKNILVVAPIPLVEATPHQAEFFMPSLLKSIQPAELDKIRSSFTISPLAVYFRSGCIRSGVFCCLVVDVIKRLGWKVLLPSGKPICFAKNCIQLKLPKLPCTVTLIDSFLYLEVYIKVLPSLRKELCPVIRNEILKSIRLSCALLHYINDTPETGIFCPCKKSTESIRKLHLADVSERNGCKFWMCSLEADVWGELSDEDRIWLDNSEGSGESSSVTRDVPERTSDQLQHPGELSSVIVMEDVCKRTGVRDQQLDQEIPESDIIRLSEKFPHLLSVHKALTINNLQHVYEQLHTAHASASPHWFNLGLALGLSHSVLTNIDSKHRGDNVSCLREMLAKLLSTQHVTWSLLSDALKKPTVDLINLADSITVNLSTCPNLLDQLNLTPADRGDVTDVTRRCSNQAGVAHALRVWQRVDSSRATFRALVEMAIGLRRGDTATDICRFIVENTC